MGCRLVRHHRGFGDFQCERRGRHTVLHQQFCHFAGKVSVQEIAGGEVDRHRDVEAAGAPAGAGDQSLLQDHPGEVLYQPGLFDRGNEPLGGEHPPRGVVPTDECLDTTDLTGLQLDLGLVVEHELVFADRGFQLRHEREAFE